MLIILLYHNVGGQERRLNIAPQSLDRQCRLLRALGFHVAPLREAIPAWFGEDTSPRRIAVFTFDDALLGVYHHAFPLLSRYGWRATVFAVSRRLGQVADWTPFPQPTVMNHEQLIHLHEAGWEIGAHGLTHCRLPYLSASQAYHEIAQSREELQSLLNAEVTTFCYPYGDYSPSIRDMVEQAGYRLACTVRKGVVKHDDDLLALPRIAIAYSDGALGLLYRIWRARCLSARRQRERHTG